MTNGGIGESGGTLSRDFLDFIVALTEKKVDFVLVGGYALAVHGVIRATGDIDFLYRRTRANVGRLCAALSEFGAPEKVIDQEALLQSDTVTQFGKPPQRIDLLNGIDGVTFNEVWSGAERIDIEGNKVRVIGLAELERNKAATGRVRDISDVRALKAKRGSKKRRS